MTKKSSEAESVPAPWPKDAVPVVALRNTVLFPGVVTPLSVGRKASLQAIDQAARHEAPIGILTQKEATVDEPKPEQLFEIGTLADVLRIMLTPDGTPMVVVRGRHRFRVAGWIHAEPYLLARGETLPDHPPATPDFEARVLLLRQLWVKLVSLLPQPMPELANAVESVEDPSVLVDLVASSLELPVTGRQELLETLDLSARLQKVMDRLGRQVEVMELSKKIDSETKESLDKSQREFYLRQQMRTIQKELGDDDPRAGELAELKKKIADAKFPPEVEKQAQEELHRLERTPEASGESAMIRTYLDWLLALPFTAESEEHIDMAKARAQLDADHHDLEKVKKRILEILAVRKLKPTGRSPILCFVGPPGTGKTSVGKSIAAAMNRNFVRQSLGGVHDESEIRGHRRTYVGALPGRIIQGLKKAGTRNPVFMLDEIDKLSASLQGDPSAALLEVLDPEQNSTFEDHYLGLPFDLSHVLFICTANVLDNVPGPLRDRMEVMELPGYPEEDKLQIAKGYLVARQREENGLTEAQITFTDEALQELVRRYTREAGVRQLERELGSLCRAVATLVAEGRTEPMVIGKAEVGRFLGPARFHGETALRTSLPGVATGLAWTPFGGDILFVEATRMPGKGGLVLTGQLGDVMKESAQAALSLTKIRAAGFGIDQRVFQESDLHIHLPAGAIPKDGPSAGVTLLVALVSLLTGRRVRHDVAMTGEISLRGLVLPVGGIKEKVLAARRAGIKTVIMPELNENDLQDVPSAALADLHVDFVGDVDRVLELALLPDESASPPVEVTPAGEPEAVRASPHAG